MVEYIPSKFTNEKLLLKMKRLIKIINYCSIYPLVLAYPIALIKYIDTKLESKALGVSLSWESYDPSYMWSGFKIAQIMFHNLLLYYLFAIACNVIYFFVKSKSRNEERLDSSIVFLLIILFVTIILLYLDPGGVISWFS